MHSQRISMHADQPWRVALWLWLLCGLAALTIFPALRERSALLGWLPFWLIVAPALDLLLLERDRLRDRLMAMPRALLVRARRRRRPTSQARRHMRHRRARLRPLLAALLSR